MLLLSTRTHAQYWIISLFRTLFKRERIFYVSKYIWTIHVNYVLCALTEYAWEVCDNQLSDKISKTHICVWVFVYIQAFYFKGQQMGIQLSLLLTGFGGIGLSLVPCRLATFSCTLVACGQFSSISCAWVCRLLLQVLEKAASKGLGFFGLFKWGKNKKSKRRLFSRSGGGYLFAQG
jgi:hypothetical protein